jgi:hypothetical protein
MAWRARTEWKRPRRSQQTWKAGIQILKDRWIEWNGIRAIARDHDRWKAFCKSSTPTGRRGWAKWGEVQVSKRPVMIFPIAEKLQEVEIFIYSSFYNSYIKMSLNEIINYKYADRTDNHFTIPLIITRQWMHCHTGCLKSHYLFWKVMRIKKNGFKVWKLYLFQSNLAHLRNLYGVSKVTIHFEKQWELRKMGLRYEKLRKCADLLWNFKAARAATSPVDITK